MIGFTFCVVAMKRSKRKTRSSKKELDMWLVICYQEYIPEYIVVIRECFTGLPAEVGRNC
jgi:hypothetical protein